MEQLAGNLNPADMHSPLGGKSEEANPNLAQHLGISSGVASKIIPMIAPINLGALLKRGGGAVPGAGVAGGAMGGMGRILDRDGDGQILDDPAGIFPGGGNSGAGGDMGRLANKVSCLTSIPGGLLKGRR